MAEIPLGTVVGILFFGMFALGALSSAISLMEVVVAYVIDEYGLDRARVTLAIGGGMFLLGLPVALEGELLVLGLYDQLAAEILLPFGGLLLMIFVGWLYYDLAIDELQKGIGELGSLGNVWIWLVRVPVILVLVVALYLAVTEYVEFLQEDFAELL